MDKLLEISNLHFSYENKKVLNGVDFTLNRGEILCLKGKNGTGKTTLLKVLTTILKTDEYNAKYLGKEMTLEKIKRNMIFIPNSPYLYGSLTGRQNIELIRNLWKKDKSDYYDRINKYINEFEVSNYLDDFVENYSLGMKYKVYFVAALSVNCDIILMDEPLNAMDLQSQKKAINSLKDMVQGGEQAILFSSHISSLISDLATKECILCDGKIIKSN